MLPKAYGTFIQKDNLIFRTEAYLQWGMEEKYNGLIVMLNPGKSELSDKNKWNELIANNLRYISGEIILDPTIQKIVYIINEANPNFQGRVKLLNIFNLKNPKSKKAINEYRSMVFSKKYDEYLYCNFNNIERYSWIWLGWGVKKDSVLDARKYEVKSIIDNSKVHSFALYHIKYKDHIYIYHPNPRNKELATTYSEKLIKQMKEYFNE